MVIYQKLLPRTKKRGVFYLSLKISSLNRLASYDEYPPGGLHLCVYLAAWRPHLQHLCIYSGDSKLLSFRCTKTIKKLLWQNQTPPPLAEQDRQLGKKLPI